MRLIVRHALYFVWLSLCPVALLAQESWTLPQLIEQAHGARQDIAAQQALIDAARWQVKEAFSHYLPRVEVAGSLVKTYEPLTLDLSDSEVSAVANTNFEIPGLISQPISAEVSAPLPNDVPFYDDTYGDATVTLRQPLYTWGRIKHSVAAAKAMVSHEQDRLGQHRLTVTRDVREAYYALSIAKDAMRFADKKVSELNIVKALLENMLENTDAATGQDGQPISRLDLMETEGFLLRAKGMRLAAADLERQAFGLLKLAIGKDDMDMADIEIAPLGATTELAALDRYLDLAKSEHPLLRALQEGIIAQEHRYRAEKAARYPELGIGLFYQNLGGVDSSFRPNHHVGAMLSMRMPLFDGGEIQAKAQQVAAKRTALAHQLGLLSQQIATTVTDGYHRLQHAQMLLQLDDEELAIIRRRRQLALFGLRSQTTPYADYREALKMQVEKRREYHEHLLQRYRAETELLLAIGQHRL